jgi:mono/diheme cytochrome c family protein
MSNRLLACAAVGLATLSASSAFVRATPAGRTPAAATPRATSTPSTAQGATTTPSPQRALLNRYCVGCHNQRTKSGNLSLDIADVDHIAAQPQVWEKVIRKLGAGMMPPVGLPRPDEAARDEFVAWLSTRLENAFDAHPNPGRTQTFHRLNRTEYRNAVRDLFSLDVEVTELLPADDSSYGFDNIAGVLKLSQSLMERYLSAARTIARIAVGSPPPAVGGATYRVAPDSQQHDRVGDLPIGTRGGTLVRHLFPQDAEYDFKIELAGAGFLREEHKLELTLDGRQVNLFALQPRSARPAAYAPDVDGKLEVTVAVTAGPHDVGAAFYRKPADLVETVREPFQNPRISGNDGVGGSMPVVTSVTIIGPHNATGPGDTPSRRRIFTCRPGSTASAAQDLTCAKAILTQLARRAYRGLVAPRDVDTLLQFYAEGRKNSGTFDAGIEYAIRRLLVDPAFLFRVETDPSRLVASARTADRGAAARGASNASNISPASSPAAYRISDLELASRISFFIWSSIPDEELLKAAEQGRLKDPAVLEREVRRMIADPRSAALTENFAGQWLLVRNIATVRPGDPYSLTFDETLREAMQKETELFFDAIVRENRPVPELLTADFTFLNERLADHYDIPGVQGSHFRRVTLPADSPRRGILGQGSVLTVTSHAIRTSPVIRGKWILNNILGTPPPDPPPNVPALSDQRTQARVKTMRERMSQHRSNPVCASCHNMIDPAGFALENFDAIGRWRTVDESFNPIDASGALPDGAKFDGVAQLRAALVRRPERFVNTVTEKLLTYALGRGLESYDMPAVRRIVRDAAADEYRFQAVILGVVKSYPFLMRSADPATAPANAGQ